MTTESHASPDRGRAPARHAEAPRSRVIAQAVGCDWQRAYQVAADPARYPEWASGLAEGEVTKDEQGGWWAQTPGGRARLRFAPHNTLGVLDHWVWPEGGDEVYVPFRVIALGPQACELQLSLLRQPGMDAAAFERDAEWVARDLASLAQLLESL